MSSRPKPSLRNGCLQSSQSLTAALVNRKNLIEPADLEDTGDVFGQPAEHCLPSLRLRMSCRHQQYPQANTADVVQVLKIEDQYLLAGLDLFLDSAFQDLYVAPVYTPQRADNNGLFISLGSHR